MQQHERKEKILVRMPNWVGDFVMATPILSLLRKKFPNAHITAMCKKPLKSLIEKDPNIDEILPFEKPSGNFFKKNLARKLTKQIKQGQYDLGILLTNSLSSAWWFFAGGVKRRIGFSLPIRKWLLTDKISFPENRKIQHLVITYQQLLKPLGITPSLENPKLFRSPEVKKKMENLLFKEGVLPDQKKIIIHPGASYGLAKCWLPERFTKLADKIQNDPDTTVIFVGAFEQKPLIDSICHKSSRKAINLAGKTTLMELACIISMADVFVTNDSGPMHIGAALNIPLVALFGSTSPIATGPYNHEAAVIYKKVSCSPCFQRTCNRDFACMKSITVEDVLRKIKMYQTMESMKNGQ